MCKFLEIENSRLKNEIKKLKEKLDELNFKLGYASQEVVMAKYPGMSAAEYRELIKVPESVMQPFSNN